jgi:hypothetical protein
MARRACTIEMMMQVSAVQAFSACRRQVEGSPGISGSFEQVRVDQYSFLFRSAHGES